MYNERKNYYSNSSKEWIAGIKDRVVIICLKTEEVCNVERHKLVTFYLKSQKLNLFLVYKQTTLKNLHAVNCSLNESNGKTFRTDHLSMPALY